MLARCSVRLARYVVVVSNIQLSQPGSVGTLTADGRIGIGVRCYLSPVGVTLSAWALLSKPSDSAATIVKHPTLGWYFDPDVASDVPYVVRLTDSLLATHTNSFICTRTPNGIRPGLVPDQPLHLSAFGVKSDGKFITDGVVLAGRTSFTSATAQFTPSDTGKKMLLRTPSNKATGTLSITGDTATGTGENFPVDMPIVGGGGGTGQPSSGGAFYCDGQWLVASFSVPSTHNLVLYAAASPAIVNKPYYTEVQLEVTLTYVSPTEMTMSQAATISDTNVQAFYATDDTAAWNEGITTAFASGAQELKAPDGFSGVFDNLVWQSQSNLRIYGSVGTRCTIVSLRRASRETAFPNAANNYGKLSFLSCDGIFLENIGFDGSVAVLGTGHSAGGVANTSGSNIGIFFRTCTNSGLIGCFSHGYGARDEHFYVDGKSTNFLFDKCVVVGNNNVSMNCDGGFDGGGNPQPDGLRIVGCVVTSILVSAASYAITGCTVWPGGANVQGNITVDLIGSGIISDCTIYGFTLTQGVGMIDCFGNNVAGSSLRIVNCTFLNNVGPWYTGGGSLIHLSNFGGTAYIGGCTFKGCTATGAGGRFIYVEGAATGSVHIDPSVYETGALMTVGVEVAANVPAGAVTVAAGGKYGASITTRWNVLNAGGLGRLDHKLTVAATGATAVPLSCDYVLVTANGAVGITLPDPTLRADRPITVKNDTTQAGTTTVGTAAGNIDGAATFVRTGAGRSVTLRSDGTNWKVEGSYL